MHLPLEKNIIKAKYTGRHGQYYNIDISTKHRKRLMESSAQNGTANHSRFPGGEKKTGGENNNNKNKIINKEKKKEKKNNIFIQNYSLLLD